MTGTDPTATSTARAPMALLLLLALASCAVRSISNPARPWGDQNTTYAGELSDFDVVGTAAARSSDGAGEEARLRPGARLLVVQSGALFPDEPMLTALGEHFEVQAASGIPSANGYGDRGLLDAAARGGFDTVLAYWGVLESQSRPTAGKAAVWVPIVGFFVPDESQRMRIRLRLVVADVQTGRWRSLLSVPHEDERESSFVYRDMSDFEQVQALKQDAYDRAAALVAGLAQQ